MALALARQLGDVGFHQSNGSIWSPYTSNPRHLSSSGPRFDGHSLGGNPLSNYLLIRQRNASRFPRSGLIPPVGPNILTFEGTEFLTKLYTTLCMFSHVLLLASTH